MKIPEHLKDKVREKRPGVYTILPEESGKYKPQDPGFKKYIQEVFRIRREIDEYQLTQDCD
jgi:hypothetical protein